MQDTGGAVEHSLVGCRLEGELDVERYLCRFGTQRAYVARRAGDGGKSLVFVAPLSGAPRVSRAPLSHPNILGPTAWGVVGNERYFVSDFVKGTRLSTWISRREHVDLEWFVPLAVQIVKPFAAAHVRGQSLGEIDSTAVLLASDAGPGAEVKLVVEGFTPWAATESSHKQDAHGLGRLFYRMLAGQEPRGHHESLVRLQTLLGQRGRAFPNSLLSLIVDCASTDVSRRPPDAIQLLESLIDSVPAKLVRLPLNYESTLRFTGRQRATTLGPQSSLTEPYSDGYDSPPSRFSRDKWRIAAGVAMVFVTGWFVGSIGRGPSVAIESPVSAATATAASDNRALPGVEMHQASGDGVARGIVYSPPVSNRGSAAAHSEDTHARVSEVINAARAAEAEPVPSTAVAAPAPAPSPAELARKAASRRRAAKIRARRRAALRAKAASSNRGRVPKATTSSSPKKKSRAVFLPVVPGKGRGEKLL